MITSIQLVNMIDIDFEYGESGYSLTTIGDSEISYNTTNYISGARSLEIRKPNGTDNLTGIRIDFDNYVDCRGCRVAFWLYLSKNAVDMLSRIELRAYDINNKSIVVTYWNFDDKCRSKGIMLSPNGGWNYLVWGFVNHDSIDSGYDYSKLKSIEIRIYTRQSSNIIGTGELLVDRLILNKYIDINVDTNTNMKEIVDAVPKYAPLVDVLGGYDPYTGTSTYLLRTCLYIGGGTIDFSNTNILVDEFATWARYGNIAIRLKNVENTKLILGKFGLVSGFYGTPIFLQVSTGYPWGALIYGDRETPIEINSLVVHGISEHRIYVFKGSMKGIIGTQIGVFPRGQYDITYQYVFQIPKQYVIWIHPPISVSELYILTSRDTPLRTELEKDLEAKNLYLYGVHRRLLHITYWDEEPNPIKVKLTNVYSYNVDGTPSYGFRYTNTRLTSQQYIKFEVWQEINFRLSDKDGNPFIGAKIEIYDKNGDLNSIGTTNNNGEALVSALIYRWEGYINEKDVIINTDDLEDLRPHKVIVEHANIGSSEFISYFYTSNHPLNIPIKFTRTTLEEIKNYILHIKDVSENTNTLLKKHDAKMTAFKFI